MDNTIWLLIDGYIVNRITVQDALNVMRRYQDIGLEKTRPYYLKTDKDTVLAEVRILLVNQCDMTSLLCKTVLKSICWGHEEALGKTVFYGALPED